MTQRRITVRSGPLTTVTVLAILPDLSDRVSLFRIFDHSNWKLHLAGDSQEAQAALRDLQVSAVICESRLPDGCWKDVLSQTLAMADPPPVIVTDRLAASSLWAEVLSMGGYDLLMKPFDQTEVYRVVGLAWLFWRNRFGRADTPRKGPEPAQRSDTLTKRAGSAA